MLKKIVLFQTSLIFIFLILHFFKNFLKYSVFFLLKIYVRIISWKKKKVGYLLNANFLNLPICKDPFKLIGKLLYYQKQNFCLRNFQTIKFSTKTISFIFLTKFKLQNQIFFTKNLLFVYFIFDQVTSHNQRIFVILFKMLNLNFCTQTFKIGR